MYKSLCSTVGLIVLVTTSAEVCAQQEGAEPAAGAAQPRDTGSADESRGPEVIVTGTRTAKAVDKIPGAITVIAPADVQHELTLTEDATAILARTVPGYSESSHELNTIGETLRGREP